MQARRSKGSQCFFLRNMGPTLEFLSNFSNSKAVALLLSLTRQSRQFYMKNQQGMFRHCHPTILSQQMTHVETVTNLLSLPVTRVIHLRDDLFLVGYVTGVIELRDFSRANPVGNEPDEPIAAFNAAELDAEGRFDYMRDFDCKAGDESKIVMIFDSGAVGFLNLRERLFHSEQLGDDLNRMRAVKFI